jgi:hypothetical protein
MSLSTVAVAGCPRVAGLCDKPALLRDVIKNVSLCFYVICMYTYVRTYLYLYVCVCMYCMRIGT